jgi:hypothetical protein
VLVADYLTPGANLNTGQINGDYSYVDGSTEPGTPHPIRCVFVRVCVCVCVCVCVMTHAHTRTHTHTHTYIYTGVWVYRVQEEDMDGKRSTLSQTIIEVASNTDKIKTLVHLLKRQSPVNNRTTDITDIS